MPQPLSVAGGRPFSSATKLSEHEREVLTRLKGGMTDAQYWRWLLLTAEKAEKTATP